MTARRILTPLLVALVVLGALFASWRAGRNADAVTEGGRWAKMQPSRAQDHQLLAAAWLSAGNDDAARPHLQSLAQASRVWIPMWQSGW